MKKKIRLENDPLGNISVPEDAYYGSQTQRAVQNFQISGLHLPREFIEAQGIIKASAAAVNIKLNALKPDIGRVIIDAAEEVRRGMFDGHFVVDVFQAGAGTSQNNNANEIIARRAAELSGGKLSVHPNDHVNMSQSTNDTFPSALNIAAAFIIQRKLLPALDGLIKELTKKSKQFMHVLKAGRTHLHDGVPMKLGQEFEGYAATVSENRGRILSCLDELYLIGMGGAAIGTDLNPNPAYRQEITSEIARRSGLPLKAPECFFSFMQNMNAPLSCLSALKQLAVHLIKITSDLRLLSSGPRTGLSEINLPSVQPGSTIMPGKVNPAMLEMTHMVCCQIIGNETAASLAGTGGQLEINVLMPFIAHAFLYSLEILSGAVQALSEKCIKGISANEEKCRQWADDSLSLVTGLSPLIGYDAASHIGMEADINNKTLLEVMTEKGLASNEYISAINPESLS